VKSRTVILIILSLSSMFMACKPADSESVQTEVVNSIQWVKRTITVSYTEGLVELWEEDWREIFPGDELKPGDQVRTSEASRAELQIGSHARMVLEENTLVVLDFFDSAQANKSLFTLDSGTISNFVNKLQEDDSYLIRTEGAVAGVRGTEFLIKHKDGKSTIAVKEGRVALVPVKASDEEKDIETLITDTQEVLEYFPEVDQGSEITLVDQEFQSKASSILVSEPASMEELQQQIEALVEELKKTNALLEQLLQEENKKIIEQSAEPLAVPQPTTDDSAEDGPVSTEGESTGQEAAVIEPEPESGKDEPAIGEAVQSSDPVAEKPMVVFEGQFEIGRGEGNQFRIMRNGEVFIPFGVNYAQYGAPGYDALFATRNFDGEKVDQVLSRLSRNGINTVRVAVWDHFGDQTGIQAEPYPALNPGYLFNIKQFLLSAKKNNIAVIISLKDLPGGGPYGEMSRKETGPRMADQRNGTILTGSGIAATERFWTDFINGLKSIEAPLDQVLAWSIYENLYLSSIAPPLNIRSGEITLANRKTYNLQTQKDQLVNESLGFFVRRIARKIRELDPERLVTCGILLPSSPVYIRRLDGQVSAIEDILASGSLDFLELNLNPAEGQDFKTQMANFRLQEIVRLPYIISSFGAPRRFYPELDFAIDDMLRWIEKTRRAGGADGWIYSDLFPRYLEEANYGLLEDGDFFLRRFSNFVNSMKNGRPEEAWRNIAPESELEVFKERISEPGIRAIDGNADRPWISGEEPPGWLTLEWTDPKAVRKIAAFLSLQPNSDCEFRLIIGFSNGEEEVFEYDDYFQNRQIVVKDFDPPLRNVEYITLEFEESESWVGLYEIYVSGR
jgi:hypothetical protein